jgi:hypothetical protein
MNCDQRVFKVWLRVLVITGEKTNAHSRISASCDNISSWRMRSKNKDKLWKGGKKNCLSRGNEGLIFSSQLADVRTYSCMSHNSNRNVAKEMRPSSVDAGLANCGIHARMMCVLRESMQITSFSPNRPPLLFNARPRASSSSTTRFCGPPCYETTALLTSPRYVIPRFRLFANSRLDWDLKYALNRSSLIFLAYIVTIV